MKLDRVFRSGYVPDQQEEHISAAQAKDHIKQINKRRGLQDGQINANATDLARALETLSNDLYNESTHCLMELIQNAEDNAYTQGVTPTLEISYEDRLGEGCFLRLDCNELGFSAKNVEAICQIGNSSKTGLEGETRYIGQKGIGFKSVFKISDVVYIHSKQYSFKFDKRTILGMINPLWVSDPPFQPRQGFTTFYLQLSTDCNKNELLQKLEHFDYQMLLFLRKLSRVTITVTSHARGGPQFHKVFERHARPAGTGQEVLNIRHPGGTQTFIMVKHIHEKMPAENKRLGASRSEIVLAFPLEADEPLVKSQNVHAFLPIRGYGFKFLIQGDFLVNASRGEILKNSLWNTALTDATREAMKKAAQSLKHLDSQLKYQWIDWLPTKSSTVDFFQKLPEKLLRDLSVMPILENGNHSWAAPSALTYVPPEFCDSEGSPLTVTKAMSALYLSNAYSETQKDILLALDVKEMTLARFLSDLQALVESDPGAFHSRSHKWHSDLAAALQAAMAKHDWSVTQHGRKLGNIALIPLRNGKWISQNEMKKTKNHVFFPSHSLGCGLPTGLTYDVVEAEAASSPNRKWLYEQLGVGEIDNRTLAQFIIDVHGSDKLNPKQLSLNDIVSQLLFLYETGWTKSEDTFPSLWMVADNEQRRMGIDIYLDTQENLSATKLLKDRKEFPFLHPRIVNAKPDNLQGWHKWLVDHAGLSYIPRLFRRLHYHKDFKHITEAWGGNIMLEVLKTHWNNYRQSVEIDHSLPRGDESNEKRKQLARNIGYMKVRCTDGVERPLHDTFLPMQIIIKDAADVLPYLDIPEPEDKRWVYVLSLFNVGCEDDLRFWIKCLECVKRITKDRNREPSYPFLCRLYEWIQVQANDDERSVQFAFSGQDLVFIPPSSYTDSGHGFWVPLRKCIWEGPAGLRSCHALKDIYPHSKKLFTDTLGVKDADITTVINEMRQFTLTDSLTYILKTLDELNKFIKDHNGKVPDSVANLLRRSSVFPITLSDPVDGFYRFGSAESNSEWFIADRPHLQQSFQGKVPILAFDAEQINRWKRMFKLAKADERLLSNAAEGVAKTVGVCESWKQFTKSLQEKVTFILRLIPDSKENRRDIFRKVRSVEAFKSEKVLQTWRVIFDGKTVHGDPTDGHVALAYTDGKLNLYFAKKSISSRKSREELTELLHDFCGLDKTGDEGVARPDYKWLLSQILEETSHKEISDLLDRKGIPPLASDEDLDEEYDRSKRIKQWKAVPESSRAVLERETMRQRLNNHAKEYRISVLSLNLGFDGLTGGTVAGAEEDRLSETSEATLFSHLSARLDGVANVGILRQGRRSFFSSRRNKDKVQVSDKQVAFAAEKKMHQVLENLGCGYDANYHWTSKLRSMAGFKSYDEAEDTNATFTFRDKTGILTSYLVEIGFEAAEDWGHSPTYHIEVKGTKGPLSTPFQITPAEFERARKYYTDNAEVEVEHVAMLVRVYDKDEKLTIVPDTMRYWLEGHLQVKSGSGYVASIGTQKT